MNHPSPPTSANTTTSNREITWARDRIGGHLGTGTEPAHFSCRHTSHGPIGDTEFLGLIGYTAATVADDFEVIEMTKEQAAESALHR